jgi:hypothetical protein
MNEVQRMQYLDALGVDSFMPRRVLPNAPTLRLCEPVLADNTTTAAAMLNRPASIPVAPSSVQPTVVQALAQLNAPTAVASADAAAVIEPKAKAAIGPEVAAVSSETVAAPAVLEQVAAVTEQAKVDGIKTAKPVIPAPRFSLSLWQIGEQLLVIDSRQPQQALPTESLLSNILLALGYPAGPLPSAHVVRWPIMENRFETQGADEARGMLSALISARLETQPAKHLLLMGEEACHFILPSGELADNQTASLSKLQGRLLIVPELAEDLPVIVVPSLTAMLKMPELKALTWQAIQPLRQ